MPVRHPQFPHVLSNSHFSSLASEGNIRALSAFVMAGGDVNEADYDGRTALHLAAGISNSVHVFRMSNEFVTFVA